MTPLQCRMCGHATFPQGGRGQRWTYRCREAGCACSTNCRPSSRATTTKEYTSMSTPQSADAFLMGGGGAPTAKFPTHGTRVEGFITEKPTVQQQRDPKDGKPKFWPDGNPMNQLVVTVQTTLRDPSVNEDDGQRRLFVKGQMKQAIQAAVKSAGGSGLEVGGYLAVTYTHDGQKPANPMLSAPKQFRAEYSLAANAELQRPDPAAAYAMPPAPQQAHTPAPAAASPAVPGLTAEQIAAAQADPAMAALLAQLQGRQAAVPQSAPEPPF